MALALVFTLAVGLTPQCMAISRHVTHHIIGQAGTHDGTSPPVVVKCEVYHRADTGEVYAPRPAVGEVIMVAVRLCDSGNHCSEWVGGP